MEDMDCNNNPSWKESSHGPDDDDDEAEESCYRLLLIGFCMFTTWMAVNAAIMGATNCIQLASQEPVGSSGRAYHIGLAAFMIPIGVIYVVICAAFLFVLLADCFSILERIFIGGRAVKSSPSSFCPDEDSDIEKGVQSEENIKKPRYGLSRYTAYEFVIHGYQSLWNTNHEIKH